VLEAEMLTYPFRDLDGHLLAARGLARYGQIDDLLEKGRRAVEGVVPRIRPQADKRHACGAIFVRRRVARPLVVEADDETVLRFWKPLSHAFGG
jgi:hypothetical protein